MYELSIGHTYTLKFLSIIPLIHENRECDYSHGECNYICNDSLDQLSGSVVVLPFLLGFSTATFCTLESSNASQCYSGRVWNYGLCLANTLFFRYSSEY